MERFHGEHLKAEDVMFVPVVEQNGTEYRGNEGGFVEPEHLPVDTMEGLMVSKDIPEGFYAESVVVETPIEEEDIWRGGSVKLTNDIQVVNVIQIENGIKSEVNLNGKTITAGLFSESNGDVLEGSSDSYTFWVKNGGELVIQGDGNVIAQEAKYSMAVWAQGGNVTINGGKFYNGGDGCDLIYASAGGHVNIYGGEFHATAYKGVEAGTTNPYSALNIKNSDRDFSDIVVYGGVFYGFDPSNNLSEPNPSKEWLEKHPNGFVASGYKSVEISDGVWEVMAE